MWHFVAGGGVRKPVRACAKVRLGLSSWTMENLIAGLWGCFFGVVFGTLAGSVYAYTRSLHRVASNAALSALAAAFYVVAFLGGLPIDDEPTLILSLAIVSITVSVLLTYLLFALLGLTKSQLLRRRLFIALGGVFLLALASGWQLSPEHFLVLSTAVSMVLGLAPLGMALKKAWSDDRLNWAVAFGIFCMLVAIAGLSTIAHHRDQVSGWVQAVSALAATLCLVTIAGVLWSRYAYLIELHMLLAYGPNYDPVTRMRSHQGTGHMVSAAFKTFRDKPQPIGVVVLTIANLYALEQLHGAAAVNHALFVCASRLRRSVPGYLQMGRLGTDGFVLVMPHCKQSSDLIDIAKTVQAQLRRSVTLNTSPEAARLETDNTLWVADIGVGVLVVSNPESRGSDAIAMGRRMSRTAISYASRIAWFDESSGEPVELPDIRLL